MFMTIVAERHFHGGQGFIVLNISVALLVLWWLLQRLVSKVIQLLNVYNNTGSNLMMIGAECSFHGVPQVITRFYTTIAYLDLFFIFLECIFHGGPQFKVLNISVAFLVLWWLLQKVVSMEFHKLKCVLIQQ